MNYSLEIIEKDWLTHNVVHFVLERPRGFQCTLGDAVDVILEPDRVNGPSAPFTLTNLPDSKTLELMIKVYPKGQGFTRAISKKEVGGTLAISDAWKSFEYLGSGTYIAAGSGITPFIPMIKEAKKKDALSGHRLIYANKNVEDIILEKELHQLLGSHFYNILSEGTVEGYSHGRMDINYLSPRIVELDQFFYVCGPDDFSKNIRGILKDLGVDQGKIQIGY